MMVGIIASVRVIIRRIHGDTFRWMKPSITTCPASVPVIDEFCPLANRATANSVLAPAAPSSGLSSL